MNSLLVISLLLSLATDKTSEYVTQGMNLFRDGRVRESLTQFDRAIEIAPQVEPYLWQRGISQYCLGDYAAGRRQFELHQDVNPNDVENAAWHYFCVAKREGKKAAQKALLPINTEHDQRVPMKQIYQYLAGEATQEDVLRAATQENTPLARMYAHLYLGLCSEIQDDGPQAMHHLQIASSQKLKGSYMQDVAKVMLDQTRPSGNKSDTNKH